jgi:crotonobetainyl-CoA:carnitine CoA-transferase CaiB-like acyl-CoA transferase
LPLEGILVVSMEQAVAAPYCSSRLADAGARVIKIERPEGDFARAYDRFANGESAYFVWLNRGKQSLTANIKDPDDAALLHRIIDRADVFIQNLAPGAAARSGFGSEALRARNERLITVDISGYGDEGPYADMKAYDLLVQAESGMCSVTGTPDGPGRVGVSICDVSCGMYCHAAVLEALIARERTGRGTAIDNSLFAGMADWMTVPLLHYESDGKGPPRVGLNHPSIHPYGAYETQGAPILIAIQNEREFARLCADVLGDASLPEDPRFESNVARLDHRPEFDAIIVKVFKFTDRDELIRRLREAQIAYGEVNDVAGLSHHPALRRVSIESPSGAVDIVAPPARHDRQVRHLGPVPSAGEHTDAIKQEFAA